MATVKGTWRFNDTIVDKDISYQNVRFSCVVNGEVKEFIILGLEYISGYLLYLYTDSASDAETVYYFSRKVWSDDDYKTITFTSEQEVTDEFYAWFTANATRIDEEETPIATITYKGETLETLNGGEYVTLHTKGKTMEDDIRVEVAAIAISEDSPLPIEIATEEEMNALLDTAEVGSVYKYTGETNTFENGALYVVEESE